MVYILMAKEYPKVRKIVKEKGLIAYLLMKYQDVFPIYLPQRLPPIRGIENQIDLIPGAYSPNKDAYRCNLEETREL